jgi:hypothetical protein
MSIFQNLALGSSCGVFAPPYIRLICFLLLSLAVNAQAAVLDGDGISYDLGDSAYPILYTGDSIQSASQITDLRFFRPFFGKHRGRVNPVKPLLLEERRLQFTKPGEYYLKLNGRHSLKVLVLSKAETVSSDVLRIFDFLLANMVFCDGNDADWYADAEKAIGRLFTTKAPLALLCGPSHELFRRLVADRLALPSRIASFPGVYIRESRILRSTHNVAEVYLPDVHKFVFFDINNAFAAKWLSAMELSRAIHSVLDDDVVLTLELWRSLGLKVHDPKIRVLKPTSSSCKVYEGPVNFTFDKTLLSSEEAKDNWLNFGMHLYGGVAYNGFWKGYGVDYLGDLMFASLHENPDLLAAVISWENEYGLEPRVVTPDDLKAALDNGVQAIIESKPWLRRIKKYNIKKYLNR